MVNTMRQVLVILVMFVALSGGFASAMSKRTINLFCDIDSVSRSRYPNYYAYDERDGERNEWYIRFTGVNDLVNDKIWGRKIIDYFDFNFDFGVYYVVMGVFFEHQNFYYILNYNDSSFLYLKNADGTFLLERIIRINKHDATTLPDHLLKKLFTEITRLNAREEYVIYELNRHSNVGKLLIDGNWFKFGRQSSRDMSDKELQQLMDDYRQRESRQNE